MDDPLSALKEALQPVFQLTPIRGGVFTYQEIKVLNEELEAYQSHQKGSLVKLIKALGAALHHFEKWQINFDTIKTAVDALVENQKMPAVNWDKFLSPSKHSRRFSFSAQNSDLFSWISVGSKKNFTELKQKEQISLLITYSQNSGFSQRISDQLKKDPEFLSRYIMDSKENFVAISNSRLILYLTDIQIAHAIIECLPSLIPTEESNQFVQTEYVIEKINTKILSRGRSISTLLRSEAKSILERSELFQIYQSDEYNNRDAQPSQENEKVEIEYLGP